MCDWQSSKLQIERVNADVGRQMPGSGVFNLNILFPCDKCDIGIQYLLGVCELQSPLLGVGGKTLYDLLPSLDSVALF